MRFRLQIACPRPESPRIARHRFFARAILGDPRRLRGDRLASRGLGWPRSGALFVDSEAGRGQGEARAASGPMALARRCYIVLLRLAWLVLAVEGAREAPHNYQWLTSVIDTPKGAAVAHSVYNALDVSLEARP